MKSPIRPAKTLGEAASLNKTKGMNPPPGLGGVPQQQPQQLIPPTPQPAATTVQHQPSMQELLLFNQMNQMALMGTLTPMQQMQLMMTIMGNQAQNNFVNMNQLGQAQVSKTNFVDFK